MVQVHFATREVTCRIVYYGPPGSGKASSLRLIQAKEGQSGEVTVKHHGSDREVGLELVPRDLGTLADMKIRLHLVTVSGPVLEGTTWKEVLGGADGIVFVADSTPDKLELNLNAIDDLETLLRENGLDPETIPMVFQWSKRDLSNAQHIDRMDEVLNRGKRPNFEAAVTVERGFVETLQAISKLVVEKLQKEQGYAPGAQQGTRIAAAPAGAAPKPSSIPRGAAFGMAPASAPPPKSPPKSPTLAAAPAVPVAEQSLQMLSERPAGIQSGIGEQSQSQSQESRLVDEDVQFTVYRPRKIKPERWYPLLAFAHLAERRPDADPGDPDPVEEVKRQARQILGEQADRYKDVTQDSRQGVPREGEITFTLSLPGMAVNPSRRSFKWLEDVQREEFRIRAPGELDGKTVRGALTVYWGSILLADVPLAIRVDAIASETDDAAPESSHARPYRRIFASYSRKDQPIVRQFELYAETLGDRYLRDCTNLRSGEMWTERLMQMITEADVFQLFWSNNSMNSPHVRKEWEYALSLHRDRFVRPTYWEEPFPESADRNLPPPELRELHFQKLPTVASMATARPPAPAQAAGGGVLVFGGAAPASAPSVAPQMAAVPPAPAAAPQMAAVPPAPTAVPPQPAPPGSLSDVPQFFAEEVAREKASPGADMAPMKCAAPKAKGGGCLGVLFLLAIVVAVVSAVAYLVTR